LPNGTFNRSRTGTVAAKKKEIKEIGLADIGLSDADVASSGMAFHKMYVPEKTKETVFLEGDTKEIVAKLVEHLKNDAKVV
jgi:electron transfer flavoprotein alpha/beta subunit